MTSDKDVDTRWYKHSTNHVGLDPLVFRCQGIQKGASGDTEDNILLRGKERIRQVQRLRYKGGNLRSTLQYCVRIDTFLLK